MSNSRVAIITGAGSGIGRAVATQLAAAGYQVALVGRSAAKLRETAELAQAHGAMALVISADITQPQACRQAVDEAAGHFQRIDALINVAGYAAVMPIAAVTDESWRQTIDTNLSSMVHLTAAAWPHLKSSGGIVVNVSSMASIDPFPGLAIYAAAKAAVNMFTHCTAGEGAADGIRAVAIAPGAVETAMLRSLFDEQALPRERALPADAVAQAIVDCVTGRRAFKAGETIVMKSP